MIPQLNTKILQHLIQNFETGSISLSTQEISNYNNLYNQVKTSNIKKINEISRKRKQLLKILNKSYQVDVDILSNSISNYKNCTEQDGLTFYTIQSTELIQEIQQTKITIRTLKEGKQNMQTQLAILNSKDQQIRNALAISRKDCHQAMFLLQNEKKQYARLQAKQQSELKQLNNCRNDVKHELKEASLAIIFGSKKINKYGVNIQNSDQVGTLQEQDIFIESIYSKLQVESALRCFYVILKLKERWQNEDWSNENIENQLDTIEKIRLMDKYQIFKSYQQKGCVISDSMVEKVFTFYDQMRTKFERVEWINLQLTQNLNQLRKTEQQLNISLQKMEENKAKQTIQKLIEDEKSLKLMEDKVFQTCKVIFKFNLLFYSLIKKIISLNKTFDKIMKRAKTRFKSAIKKTFVESTMEVLNSFQHLLERSPQDIKLKWNCVIYSDGHNQQVDQYMAFIMKNDLVRMLASPKLYNNSISSLQNQDLTYDKVFQFEEHLIDKFYSVLNNLFKVAIQAIQSHQHQIGAYQQQIDDDNTTFCVESNQYFRRDNYKLLEKLERLQLKKNGLFIVPPFEIGIQNEVLQDEKQPILDKKIFSSCRKLGLQQKLSNTTSENISSHTNIISEKRNKMATEEKSLRNILGEISQIASKNYKYRIKKQRNTYEPKTDTSRF